jgi:hypothetical protein
MKSQTCAGLSGNSVGLPMELRIGLVTTSIVMAGILQVQPILNDKKIIRYDTFAILFNKQRSSTCDGKWRYLDRSSSPHTESLQRGILMFLQVVVKRIWSRRPLFSDFAWEQEPGMSRRLIYPIWFHFTGPSGVADLCAYVLDIVSFRRFVLSATQPGGVEAR